MCAAMPSFHFGSGLASYFWVFAMAPWLQCRHSVAELERLLSEVSVILSVMQRIGGMSSVALQLSDGIAAFDRLYAWVQWCHPQLAF